MAIEYLGLSEINGPLVVLEGVKNASYEEIVSFRMDDGTEKLGRIIEIYGPESSGKTTSSPWWGMMWALRSWMRKRRQEISWRSFPGKIP